MSDIQEKVTAIVAQALKIPATDLDMESMFGDIPEWDSLKHVTMITEVENSFDLIFDVDQITEIECIEDIIDLVNESLGEATA